MSDDRQQEMRRRVEGVLAREPRTIILYAETADGHVVTMAVGSEIDVRALEGEGQKALLAMFVEMHQPRQALNG
jgi:hypothetical protein